MEVKKQGLYHLSCEYGGKGDKIGLKYRIKKKARRQIV